LSSLPGCRLTQKVQANEVFAGLPREHIAALQGVASFQVWTEATSEARFVTSFDTAEDDVTGFLAAARDLLNG
jgi:threonine aldolase